MFLSFFKARFANDFLQHFLNKCKIQDREPTQTEIKYLKLINEFYLKAGNSEVFYNSKIGYETILADLDSLNYLNLPPATKGYVYFYKSELNIKLKDYPTAISNLDHFLNSTGYRSFISAIISKAACYIELESFNTGIEVLTSGLKNLGENTRAYLQLSKIINEYLKLIKITSNDASSLKTSFTEIVSQMQEDTIKHKGIIEVIEEAQKSIPEFTLDRNLCVMLPLYNAHKNPKAGQKAVRQDNPVIDKCAASSVKECDDKIRGPLYETISSGSEVIRTNEENEKYFKPKEDDKEAIEREEQENKLVELAGRADYHPNDRRQDLDDVAGIIDSSALYKSYSTNTLYYSNALLEAAKRILYSEYNTAAIIKEDESLQVGSSVTSKEMEQTNIDQSFDRYASNDERISIDVTNINKNKHDSEEFIVVEITGSVEQN